MKLSKSIYDVSWSLFRTWLEYYGKISNVKVVSINPAYTSINCSDCGNKVQKSLSERTHICKCGFILDRDENAARNILAKAFEAVGHTDSLNASGQNIRPISEISLLGKSG